MRPDHASHEERILAALRAGEMTTTELCGRLGVRNHHITRVLRHLEARGIVVCVSPAQGNVAGVWDLARRLERSA